MQTRYWAVALALMVVCGCAGSGEVAFEMQVINANSPYEAASVFDVNRDGKLDIFCGGFWYEAPNWEKHFVREIAAQQGYHDDFSNLPVDVDGDGWTDVISSSWFAKSVSWIRHPGKPGTAFEAITIDDPGNIETAILADINGDGQPDLLPNVAGNVKPCWYEFVRDPSAKHGVSWKKHMLPEKLSGAGGGAGDINGDGLCDIIGGRGWAEQKPDGTWTWQEEFELPDASIPILVHDVDEDGDMDIIWGTGHGYGVYWLEQERNVTGKRVWSKHEIDSQWSQAHIVLLGDLDGDGRKELITGKRFWAHNGQDPGSKEPRCIYYYRFHPATREWSRHTISENGPAGAGLSTELVDIDADGDLDFIAPGKSGLYLFRNLRN